MKNKYTKTGLIVTLLTASSLVLVNNAWAQTTSALNKKTTEQERVANAMQQVGDDIANVLDNQLASLKVEVKQLFSAGFKITNQENYQTIPNLTEMQNANTAGDTLTVGDPVVSKSGQNPEISLRAPQTYDNASPHKLADSYAQMMTQNNINNTMKQFNYALRPFSNESNKVPLTDAQKLYAIDVDQNNKLTGLGMHTHISDNGLAALSGVQANIDPSAAETGNAKPIYPANDTLFLDNLSNIDPYTEGLYGSPAPYYVSKPKEANNSMLNFAALITPNAYNDNQLQDARNYIKFATQDTVNLFPSSSNNGTGGLYGITFDFDKITQLQTKDQGRALFALKQDPNFQRFKFNLRTQLALRSVSTSVLNQFVAERQKIAGLGTKAGLKTPDPKDPSKMVDVKDASPLQVAAYIANHRVQSKSWFNTVQNASPATIQRDTLIVLAEIEHQNFVARMQREKLLALLATMNISNEQAQLAGFMKQSQGAVNDAIKSAIQKAVPTKDQGATTNSGDSQTPKFKQTQQEKEAAAKEREKEAGNNNN